MKERESATRNNLETVAKVAVGVALVFSGSMAFRQDQAEGKVPSKWAPYEGPFTTLVSPSVTPEAETDKNIRDERMLENRDNSPGERSIVVFSPSPTTSPTPEQTPKPKPSTDVSSSSWLLDPEISFYGPGFYGRRTACGLELTKKLEGVANRTLPCGTLVTFNWEGMTRTFPVVDRGPYISGRIFDLTGGACMAFKTAEHPRGHCFTGPINYRIGK